VFVGEKEEEGIREEDPDILSETEMVTKGREEKKRVERGAVCGVKYGCCIDSAAKMR